VRRLHIMAMEDPLKQCHIANEEQRRKRPMLIYTISCKKFQRRGNLWKQEEDKGICGKQEHPLQALQAHTWNLAGKFWKRLEPLSTVTNKEIKRKENKRRKEKEQKKRRSRELGKRRETERENLFWEQEGKRERLDQEQQHQVEKEEN